MLSTLQTLLVLFAIPSFSLNDFRIGIQLATDNSGNCVDNVGDVQYTNWARNGGGWSSFATTSNDKNPDCLRFVLHGRTLSGISNEYLFQNIDFRVGIQASPRQSKCGGK